MSHLWMAGVCASVEVGGCVRDVRGGRQLKNAAAEPPESIRAAHVPPSVPSSNSGLHSSPAPRSPPLRSRPTAPTASFVRDIARDGCVAVRNEDSFVSSMKPA